MIRKRDTTETLRESESTWIGEGCDLSGEFRFVGSVRVFGKLRGEVHCARDSELIVMPTGVVEGIITGDRIIVAGFVSGEIQSTGKIFVASSGRVVGKLHTPSLQVDFGAVVEAETSMPPLAS